MMSTPAGKPMGHPAQRPGSGTQPTHQPPTPLAREQAVTPRVPVAQLQKARLTLLGSEQAGDKRGGTQGSGEQDLPPTGPVPVTHKDFYPLPDRKLPAPDVDMFWDQRVRATELGTGRQNTVFLMQGQERDGNPLELAFKPALAGTDRRLQNQPMRNVLAYRVDQLLGFGVIVPACLQEPSGDDKASGGGLFMARARGDLAVNVARKHPQSTTSPALCRELVKLDVVDYLLQADDRIGNYLIDQGSDGKFKVTGIDNDMTFLDLPVGEPEDHLSVLDTEMAAAVLKLTRADLQSAIAPNTLTRPQMSRLLQRLDALHKYVQAERDSGRLISPSAWAQHSARIETGLMAHFSGRPQNQGPQPGDDGMPDDAPVPVPTGRISPGLLDHFDVPMSDR